MSQPIRKWTMITAAAAVAAGISAVMAVFSVIGGNMILAVISGISMVLLAASSFLAWTIRSKISEMEQADEEVRCLKLKTPGIERREEEIVPKGKMPKE
ncbi:MAG: hypothetical protein FWG60_02995 [Methanomassiliicoccaceae archaeon]|nr:hypothetical protein [Methanomassiliicoccaceae archaeon]